MKRAILILAAMLSIACACAALEDYSDLGCITDEECAAHCPPPADDPECDGGPQLVVYEA